MKKEAFLLAMNDIDDKYIEEAKPEALAVRRRKKRMILLVACMSLVFALGLFLFIPYSTKAPSMNRFSSNEYYEIIDKLNQYYYVPPKYKNNFDALVGGFSNLFSAMNKGTSDDEIALEGNGSFDMLDGGTYEEVTDNQVAGVIESDLFKRSDKYIYYFDHGYLAIYSIEGESSKLAGCFNLDSQSNDREFYSSTDDRAVIYLSEDCTTVTVLLNSSQYKYGDFYKLRIFSLDVTDPENVFVKNTVTYDGGYVSSRMINGKIYVISNYTPEKRQDYENADYFIPSYSAQGEKTLIDACDIYAPEELSSSGYTVLTKLDEMTLDVEDELALLSFNNPVIYVSQNSFWFARNYTDRYRDGIYEIEADTVEVCKVSYGEEGFGEPSAFTVEGNVNDQYSFDEHGDTLRLFVSTDYSKEWSTGAGRYAVSNDTTGINASLYVVDVATLKIRASVERFAPKGENVKSARFEGNTAYVCTAVQLTDPVFFFDLSDLDNITYKETGTVEGFSTSLVNFGNGYLLGIGQKDWDTPKIEIYKEEGDKVVSVCAIEMPDSYISSDYKAYYIDRERGYVGLAVRSYGRAGYGYSEGLRYVIFKFENDELTVVSELSFDYSRESGNYPDLVRGTYIDGYFYLVRPWDLDVITLK